MGVAEKLYELAKSLPEAEASELLDFAEFLVQKRSHQQPTDVAKMIEPQRLDFRQAAGLGQDVWRGVNVEQYIQQERSPVETVDPAIDPANGSYDRRNGRLNTPTPG